MAGDTAKPADVSLLVRLTSPRFADPLLIAVPVGQRSASQVTFQVPNTPTTFYAGLYTLSLAITPTGAPGEQRTTAELPFLVAPKITSPLSPLARTAIDPQTALGKLTVTLSCAPEVLPEQRVTLVLGSLEAVANVRLTQTASLSFDFTGVAAGDHWLRLRVDGAESLLIDRSDPNSSQFDASQKVAVT